VSDTIKTRLWDEDPDLRSPFLGRTVRLAGFDYFGDLLGRAGWAQTVWLLFAGEPPTPFQHTLFEDLAVALANSGPRDPAVHAAMSAGIGGSHPAAALMAALAVGAGDHGGTAELGRAMRAWQRATDTSLSEAFSAQADPNGTWPGFSPMADVTAPTVLQCLERLSTRSRQAGHLAQLSDAAAGLSAHCGGGLTLTGVAAAAFMDLERPVAQAEALHLLLRLPGALAHALEQSETSYRDFPFFALSEAPDAGQATRP